MFSQLLTCEMKRTASSGESKASVIGRFELLERFERLELSFKCSVPSSGHNHDARR
jgi:hypothetical protein